jgi:two-component sensor histidine kinase
MLRESLQEKELLLKEIHHRVKNNLQVVASMLGLQAEQARDADARTMLGECRERVMSMALVHQKLYGAADMRRIDLAELVREITSMLTSGAARVTVRFELESVIADIETAFPLSLIANELITNALRHAFRGRERGALTVSVRRVAGAAALLEIADDGVGGVTSATFERGGTLGSTIVRRLVRQLGGELTIAPGPGAQVVVRFPIPDPEA